MSMHLMRLNDKPFEQIASGQKTIEIRLWDEKRREIEVGDGVVFSRRSNEHDKLEAKVVSLVTAPTLVELFRHIDISKAGWLPGTSAEHAAADMRSFYGKEEEKKWGAVAIEIAL